MLRGGSSVNTMDAVASAPAPVPAKRLLDERLDLHSLARVHPGSTVDPVAISDLDPADLRRVAPRPISTC